MSNFCGPILLHAVRSKLSVTKSGRSLFADGLFCGFPNISLWEELDKPTLCG
jgi:hypothetical protein